MSGKRTTGPGILAGRRAALEMPAEIDKLLQQRTEEALKHANELLGHHPHRRRTDKTRTGGHSPASDADGVRHTENQLDTADNAN